MEGFTDPLPRERLENVRTHLNLESTGTSLGRHGWISQYIPSLCSVRIRYLSRFGGALIQTWKSTRKITLVDS